MKTILIFSILACFTFAGYAQKITQLEEAHVNYAPKIEKLSNDLSEFSYKVNENYTGEFMKDPIAFMKGNFDIHQIMDLTKTEKFDSYEVSFNSSKGYLKAEFDRDGALLKTSQKFKNITLPLKVRRDLYSNNKGWTMVKNLYTASGKSDRIDKGMYKIKMVNGNKSRNIKMDILPGSENSVAIVY